MSQENADPKYITVAANGQISIGKAWAGRQVKIEQIGPSEILVSAGVFLPESQATFYTKEAFEQLKDFSEWAETHAPKKTDLKALRNKLAKKAR